MSGIQSWVLDYLLNAAWQVPLLFVTAWVAARLLRAAGAAVEHRIWASALVLETVLPACSLPTERVTAVVTLLRAWLFGVRQVAGTRVTVSVGAGYVRGGVHVAPTVLTVVAALYGVCVLYFAVRLLVAFSRTAALPRGAQVTELFAESCRGYEHVFGAHEAVVALSAKVAGPVTLGVWKHKILVPATMDAELPRVDMEAALAHEFAHIARHDFAKNLVYEVLSLPMAFHPLLWMTRRRLAESREMVCDAMAAEAVEGRQSYARSLLRLASEFATRTPAVSTHAIGIFDANTFRNFERRIMSLTEKRVEMQGARRVAMVVLGVVLGMGVCASAMALRMRVAEASPVASVQTNTQDEAIRNPDGILRVKSGVMAGQVVTKTQPVYPPDAKAAKVQGAVVLKAVIGKDGSIRSLQLVSGPDELTKSAWAAVKQWTYKPYLLNGEPVEVETTITVNYSLAGE